MHMVSKKDIKKNELETVRISKNPTTVVAANGEVLTKEEATVYVRELDLFVTVRLLEETPAVLSLGKLCEELGFSHHWNSGQKPHLIENGRKMECNTANHVPFTVPGLSTTTENPATERSESMSESVRGNPSHEPAETENP